MECGLFFAGYRFLLPRIETHQSNSLQWKTSLRVTGKSLEETIIEDMTMRISKIKLLQKFLLESSLNLKSLKVNQKATLLSTFHIRIQ